MAWIPSNQDLRNHPKLRKAARRLDVPRVNLIGHLHCLWWWAIDYAPNGDLSSYDEDDIAFAADWEGDPLAFVEALRETGFIDPDSHLHDWGDYYGKYEGRKGDGILGNHVRWHEKRNVIDPDCPICSSDDRPESGSNPPEESGAIGGRIGGRSGGESQIRGDKRRGEEMGESSRGRQPHALPSSWSPSDNHQSLASSLGVDLSVEAAQFADFHQAKGSKFKDWDAAFRTWLRNAKKYQPAHLRAVGDDEPKVRYT